MSNVIKIWATDLNRRPQRRARDGRQVVERCPLAPVGGEMPVKTTEGHESGTGAGAGRCPVSAAASLTGGGAWGQRTRPSTDGRGHGAAPAAAQPPGRRRRCPPHPRGRTWGILPSQAGRAGGHCVQGLKTLKPQGQSGVAVPGLGEGWGGDGGCGSKGIACGRGQLRG